MMMKYVFLFLLFFSGSIIAQEKKHVWIGTASYYHAKFNGRKTFSGDRFDNKKLTAANNFLPIGTRVKVTNLKNRKSVVVTVNDRMNAQNHRLIDLSAEAAKQLGFFNKGLCKVRLELVSETRYHIKTSDSIYEKELHRGRKKRLKKR